MEQILSCAFVYACLCAHKPLCLRISARKSCSGVILVVLSQFLKAFGTNYIFSSSDTHQVILIWHIFCCAIWHSHFISYIFCNSFWHSIWYIFGDFLWLRSGGQYSDHKFRCFRCCCCCCCPCSFVLSLVVAENRQIGWCFHVFFEALGAKNTVNTDFFCASEHGIYDVVLPLATKNHGIYSIFWPVPSKNTGIYSMLQEVLFPCQRHKNTVNYSVLGLLLGFVEGAEGGVLKWTAIAWIIRYLGWSASPLLRKVKLNIAPLELPIFPQDIVTYIHPVRNHSHSQKVLGYVVNTRFLGS